jgi:hypothetical protein
MVTWSIDPDVKVEAGATDISSDFHMVTVHRPENGISRAIITVNDFYGKNYIANIDAFTVMKVSMKETGTDGWTKVFEGKSVRPGPSIGEGQYQTMTTLAYGYGRDDLIDNYINKSFGSTGAATGYAITKDKVAVCANPDLNFLQGGYRSNLQIINDVLLAYQGYQGGSAGMHWFVDPSKNLWIDTIGAHTVDTTNWPTWWRTDQAGSTLVEGTDFTKASFQKVVWPHFANKVVLYCDLRKPGTDIWTEAGGPTWGNTGYTTVDYSAEQAIVGDESLRLINGVPTGWAYHPSTEDAAWDLTKIGSPESIPTLNFYFYKEAAIGDAATGVNLATTDHDTDYFYVFFDVASDPDDKWVHRSIPVGPNWKTHDLSRQFRWQTSGSPVWTSINCVTFYGISASGTKMYIDDLHFAGKIIREAYHQTNINANGEVQKIVRYDVAVDDSLKASDDTGTAGHLAYGELLTRLTPPTVGVFQTPLAVDALPGQLIHVHADAYSGAAWRVDADFRIKEVVHTVTRSGAFTTWDVTSDVLNTFVPGFNDALTIYHHAMHTDPEMMNLRTTGLDPYIDRLSVDYS